MSMYECVCDVLSVHPSTPLVIVINLFYSIRLLHSLRLTWAQSSEPRGLTNLIPIKLL